MPTFALLPRLCVEQLFEQLIQGVLDESFGSADGFISETLADDLRDRIDELEAASELKKAGIGQATTFRKDGEVRRDRIHWLESESTHPAEQTYFEIIRRFCGYLNATCFTAINDFELHYACYDEGAFYKRHFDQFAQDSGRQYSLIVYLNDAWTDTDGGHLKLWLPGGEKEVAPVSGRAVFFKSDEIEHAVLPAHKPRKSVTGWLKSTRP